MTGKSKGKLSKLFKGFFSFKKAAKATIKYNDNLVKIDERSVTNSDKMERHD